MSWPNAFVAALGGATVRLRWRVRAVSSLLAPTAAADVTANGAAGGLTERVYVGGDGVEVVTWAPTFGGWRADLAGPDPGFMTLWHRGILLQLQISVDGASWYEAALGVLQNVSQTSRTTWTVTVAGLGAMVASRADSTASTYGLFDGIEDVSTALTVNYTAGDTTITVTDTTDFERETGGSYMIRLDTGSGTYFYLTATGKTATTFTGVSATGKLGTTAVNMTAGACTVTPVAYIEGHPLDCARKVMLSTGTGANGVYDTLPASWGLAFPDSVFDHPDTSRTRAVMQTASATPYVQAWTAEAGQNDPMGWISAWLQPLAAWPAIRQGLITFRAAQLPTLASAYTPPMPLDDRMIAAATMDWYFDSQPVEFYTTRVRADSTYQGTSDSAPRTRPARGFFDTDLPGFYSDLCTPSDIESEVLRRTAYWPTRLAEHYRVVCAGLQAWALTPGDLVSLTTQLVTRRPRLLGGGHDVIGYLGLVLTVQPDLQSGTVALDVACLPEAPD